MNCPVVAFNTVIRIITIIVITTVTGTIFHFVCIFFYLFIVVVFLRSPTCPVSCLQHNNRIIRIIIKTSEGALFIMCLYILLAYFYLPIFTVL